MSSLFSSPLLQLEKLEKLSLATESGHKPLYIYFMDFMCVLLNVYFLFVRSKTKGVLCHQLCLDLLSLQECSVVSTIEFLTLFENRRQ